MGSGYSLLVYRIGLLGDTIIALPALKAIRNNFPHAHITLLYNKFDCGVHPPEVLAHSGLIDEYVYYQREKGLPELVRLWEKIKDSGYNAVIYLAPTRRKPRQVLRDKLFFWSTGIKKLIGFDSTHLSSKGIAETPHESEALLQALQAAGLKADAPVAFSGLIRASGEDANFCENTLAACGLASAARQKMAAVGIGSNMPVKKWPEERFLAFGRGLIDKLGIVPLVIGGEDDKESGDRLVQAWGAGANLAGRLSIMQSHYALSKCRFYVGNDSGAMHLAVLAGLKCVAIFSSRDSENRWYPYGNGHIVLRKDVPCAGCMLQQCSKETGRCIDQIGVEDVLKACSTLSRAALPSCGK